ncbi:MAG: ABC transporter permease [Phycisphaerales bacterium]|nr:ABC transporter permease [Phycisphaerales bacterium]
MSAFILRRLLQLPLIVLIVYTTTFVLIWLVPGNPLEKEGRRPPPEVEAAMLRQYKLDDPVAFYFDYLGKVSGVAWVVGSHTRAFDFGPSLGHPDWSVNEILATGLPVSMTLGMGAIAIALAIGMTSGLVAGLRPGSAADALSQLVALAGISLPGFVTGTILLILFSAKLHWFPIGGWGGLSHAILPMIALSLPFSAYIARLIRFGMIEQMETAHVRTALAKGLSRRQAAYRHALKNAFLPVLSYLGPATAVAMTGSFVIEKVFAVPGLGRHFVDGVLGKDITLVMGVVLTYSTIMVLLNLLVDVLYRWVDPRIEAAY